MRVAFFIGSLNRGGTETLVLDLFRKKEYANFEPVLIYRNEGELSEAYRNTAVQMIRIKPTRSKIGYLFALRHLLRQEQVDILHTQTLLNGLLGVFCTCFSRVKLVASFHGFFSSFKGRLFAHLVTWCADATIFVSKYARDWYVRKTLFVPKKKSFVVYNGIDFSKFDSSYPEPDFLQNDSTVNRREINMAMVGSFVNGRSHFFVCECLKLLYDSGLRDFHFYFVGKRSNAEPELYDSCIDYCRDNGLLDSRVSFLGSREDVPSILQHIDVFVYSSRSDTFGIAVVEAIASGVPVIVNDWEVMKEITDYGKLAIIYKSKDYQDFMERICDVIRNLEQKRRDAQSNAVMIRDKFGIKQHIDGLSRVYKHVLNNALS